MAIQSQKLSFDIGDCNPKIAENHLKLCYYWFNLFTLNEIIYLTGKNTALEKNIFSKQKKSYLFKDNI